jgi:uncharacterized membrane protein
MIQFWLLVVCCLHFVMTQMLFESQHGALMAVYDALGACGRLLASTSPVMHFIRFFFLFVFAYFTQDATRRRASDSTHRRIARAEKSWTVSEASSQDCVFSVCAILV